MKTHHHPIARSTLVEIPSTPDSKSQRTEKDNHGSGQGSASALAKMKLIDRKNAQLWFGAEQNLSGVIAPCTRDSQPVQSGFIFASPESSCSMIVPRPD
jgi:hypothetical protein